MRITKRFLILCFSFAFLIFTSACGNVDKSWALKYKNIRISNGIYLYYLRMAYNKALEKLSDENISQESLEAAEIEGVSAADWIKSAAIKSCKDFIIVEVLFTECNLSFNNDKLDEMDKSTGSDWETFKEDFEKNNISKEDFHRANSVFSKKYDKIFKYMCESGKLKDASDEEIKDYYEKEYVTISSITRQSISDEESSAISAEENDEKNNTVKKFQQYADEINNGSKNFEQIAQEYKSSGNNDENSMATETLNVKEYWDSDFCNFVKNINVGKAGVFNFNDIIVLIYKNSLTPIDEPTKNEIAEIVKANKFEALIDSKKEECKIEVNDESLKDYSPLSIFKN